jgi:Ser/Thr protein kinase RdoA (MazF antagonist)
MIVAPVDCATVCAYIPEISSLSLAQQTIPMLDPVLSAYGFDINDCQVIPHGSGLINRTWLIRCQQGNFILQQINSDVFLEPALIADNIERVSSWLADHYPDTLFPRPIPSLDGKTFIRLSAGQYFRLFTFIENSVTIDVVDTPSQAFEAARKFGEFTRLLSGFPADSLHQTLPGFHDLSRRYQDFRLALEKGNPQRIHNAGHLIAYLESQISIVKQYEAICTDPGFRRRVTHHDTKISNVLFDQEGQGLCVIDLDTVMSGYFISDVGDMFRTYLSPVTEEESQISRIRVREPFFEAIVHGYLSEMNQVLTPIEKETFTYAGEFMLYMQALRFLTDYLNDDIYYGSRYEGHNYIRARNQITLLQRYQEQSAGLKAIVSKVLASF